MELEEKCFKPQKKTTFNKTYVLQNFLSKWWTKIFPWKRTLQEIRGLQTSTTHNSQYPKKWKLTFNVSKLSRMNIVGMVSRRKKRKEENQQPDSNAIGISQYFSLTTLIVNSLRTRKTQNGRTDQEKESNIILYRVYTIKPEWNSLIKSQRMETIFYSIF